MEDGKPKSIIPDVPLYGPIPSDEEKNISSPEKAGNSRKKSSFRKNKGKKGIASVGKATQEEVASRAANTIKNVREGISTAKIENAVRTTNIPMIIMIFVIVVFGLIILYSVSGPDAYGLYQNSSYFLTRQVAFTIAGFIAMFIISFIPIDFFRQTWITFSALALSFVLAVATLLMGVGREHGASRWINIGPIQLQSSEIIKVALIVAFAGYRSLLARLREEGRIKQGKTKRGKTFINMMVEFLIPVGLCIVVDFVILLQPHLSCFIIIAVVIAMCALVSEISLKSWITGVGTIIVFGGIVAVLVFAIMPAQKRDSYLKNYSHVFKRIAIFTADEDADEEEEGGLTKDDTRQIDNAHNALGSGGMWGVGLGNSRSKYNYVSEAQNDYIFSIYIEETGFVGGVLLLAIYLAIFFLCLQVCFRAKDVFSRTIATGCTTLIFVEVIMNISVELQVIPATGVTLPFVSYGGTAQVTLLMAYGLILAVSRSGILHIQKKKPADPARAIKPRVK